MSGNLEKDWKLALTFILNELDESQNNALMEILQEIPKSRRTPPENLAQIIIEHYGEEKSIAVINDALDRIPGRDRAAQDPLRPFVSKEVPWTSSQHHQVWPYYGNMCPWPPAAQGNLSDLENWSCASQASLNIPPHFQERSTQLWRKTICDVKSSGELLDRQAIVGKVVHKSELRPYLSKDKVERQLFYLVIADETASVKVLVFGKQRHGEITESKSYLFRRLIINENCLKVTTLGKVSETSAVKVPENIELEAQNLLFSETEVCSIQEVRVSDERTVVTVQGTVTEIDPVVSVKTKHSEEKRKRQHLLLQDGTGFIRVSVWGQDTEHCRELLIGDVVRLANMRVYRLYDRVSLTSTVFTKIYKVQSTGIHEVRIEIIGIIKTSRETHLEAAIYGRLHTFVVASTLLAEAFDIELSYNFKRSLLEKLPLSAYVEIQGSRIHKIKV